MRTDFQLPQEVVIRNIFPEDPDIKRSGGFGTIRGSVPYTLSGNIISLLVPLQFIGDSDGKFSYQLMLG